MRWDRLFEDLEAQLDRDEALERDAEVADRTRRERALIELHARLLANAGGEPVALRLAGTACSGVVVDVGADWLLVEDVAAQTVLVPVAAVRSVVGLAPGAQEPSLVAKRLSLGSVVRAISRDRAVVEVLDVDGHPVTGTIDGVGADHLDLAEHHADEPRRARNVVRRHVIPFAAVALIRRVR